MTKIWSRTKAPGKASVLNDLTHAPLSIAGPSVVYISGFLTTDAQHGYIAGGIKTTEDLILPHAPQTKIFATSNTSLAAVFNFTAYDLAPNHYYPPAARLLAEKIILPLVIDPAAKQPFDEDTARRNLNYLTLFAYSAGCVVAQQIYNASVDMMQEHGYTEATSRDLLQNVVLLSAGNMSRPAHEKNRFTTIYMAGSNDKAVRIKNILCKPLSILFTRYASALSIRKISATSLAVHAKIKRKLWEWSEDSTGNKTRKKISPLLPKWMAIRSRHELQHYITLDDDHSAYSKIARNVLVNAVLRTGKITNPETLLTPAAPLRHNNNHAAYAQRIKTVLSKK